MILCNIFMIFLIFGNFLHEVQAICKFTNLHCESFNKSLLEYKHCYIKAVGRNDNYINIYAKLHAIADNVTVIGKLFKRANGWRPFLYDISFDGCKFMKNRNSNPVANFFYNIFKDISNMNHSCPFDHDIIIEKLRLLDTKIRLPFPAGEYLVDTWWKINNVPWSRTNFSCEFKPDNKKLALKNFN